MRPAEPITVTVRDARASVVHTLPPASAQPAVVTANTAAHPKAIQVHSMSKSPGLGGCRYRTRARSALLREAHVGRRVVARGRRFEARSARRIVVRRGGVGTGVF